MCGILGLLLADPAGAAVSEIFEGLNMLQHRGQDAAGIVTCGPKGRLYQNKGNGMVRDVFHEEQLKGLRGNMGLAHLRYPTAGSSAQSEAQPFYVNSPYGIVFAHNGNIVNSIELREYLDQDAHRHINTDSDSELMLNIFANKLQETGKARCNEEDIFTALKEGIYDQCNGGFACVAMLAGFGIIGFRDPNGIRPLVLGERVTEHGVDYMFASESVVHDALGFKKYYDVMPGEAIIITKDGVKTVRQVTPAGTFAPDIFEYVYFARPDSVLDGISVYRSRLAMGDKLAETVKKLVGENVQEHIDVVVPVPDTSRVAALQCSWALGLKYREGFIKNRYVGRTFIMPGQQMRRKNVRRKLNAMALEFAGKNVLIVDDSIVRGTTSKEIVQMARDAGAKKVYFASCAPPIRHAHIYGIDLADTRELVAFDRDEQQIAEEIGADMVIYQTLDDLKETCSQFNPAVKEFEVGVFTGEYVTPVAAGYFEHLESLRSENVKARLNGINGGGDIPVDGEGKAPMDISLHNHHHAMG
ncbi:amidophosphoribosyltransferase [Saitoella coloradoensis]